MNILLVEDNAGDARLVVEAVQMSRVRGQVQVVEDGAAALAFLRCEGIYAAAPRPDLILLDLNLPKKDGRAVLAEVKAAPTLQGIPVIILTSTQAECDKQRTYDLGAAAFCVKPQDLDDYFSLVQTIVEVWGRRARLAAA